MGKELKWNKKPHWSSCRAAQADQKYSSHLHGSWGCFPPLSSAHLFPHQLSFPTKNALIISGEACSCHLTSVVWLIDWKPRFAKNAFNGQPVLQQKGNLESKIYGCHGCCIPFPVENQPETRQTWAARIAKANKKERKACQSFLPLVHLNALLFWGLLCRMYRKREIEMAKQAELSILYKILFGMLFVCRLGNKTPWVYVQTHGHQQIISRSLTNSLRPQECASALFIKSPSCCMSNASLTSSSRHRPTTRLCSISLGSQLSCV